MAEVSSGLSPWKKPRSVVLTKTKSLKRKSKSFSIEVESSSTTVLISNPLSTITENRNIFSVPRNTVNDKNDVKNKKNEFYIQLKLILKSLF